MSENTVSRSDRESMDVDVVIVGAGPAGLAAAIRLRQTAIETGRDISVVVVEKGAEVGAHTLSGAVIDPIGLDTLLPTWRQQGAPITTKVTRERFLYLGPAGSLPLPNLLLPPLMHNRDCYVGSLGLLVRWLGEQATELGAEIYPGFAASELLFDENGRAAGIATGDMGIGRDGAPKDTYQPGMELRARYTLLAEGARGSLTKQAIACFDLARCSAPQKYGIGIKELWEVAPSRHEPGFIQHTFGWPLDNRTGGGSFLYHYGDNRVAVGFVVHLDYQNPFLSPYDEFQRFKTHPAIAPVFEGGRRISYGARAITEGGWQSIPRLVFPGGALIGCAAGFVNVPRIKGSHNAILSGIHAADAISKTLSTDRPEDLLESYEAAVRTGPIANDLRPVRNVKPLWSRLGTVLGVAASGVDMWLNTIIPRVGLGYTLAHRKPDHATLRRASTAHRIAYPKPDGNLSFDKLTNLSFSGTTHEEDQPVHLRLANPATPVVSNLPDYDEPAQRYCPAGVYEIVRDPNGEPRFQINAQNCVHCKTCDIKDPAQNITWACPEGGGGPSYAEM